MAHELEAKWNASGLAALLTVLDGTEESPYFLRAPPQPPPPHPQPPDADSKPRRKLPNFQTVPRKLPRFAAAEPSKLPLLPLPTRVASPVYSCSEGEVNELCESLRSHQLLGLDIEWKVTYEAGITSRPTATLQLSTDVCAWVFQLSAMRSRRLPASLVSLLEDPRVIKTGCKVANDALKLRRDFGVRTHGLLDVGKLAGEALTYGQRSWNLADLVAETVGKRLPKELRMSDWEAAPLSAEMLLYAAADAYASRLVCVALLRRLKPRVDAAGGGPPQGEGEEAARLLRNVPPALIEVTEADPMQAKREAAALAAAEAGVPPL